MSDENCIEMECPAYAKCSAGFLSYDLGDVYCTGQSPRSEEATPDDCRECLREWLAQPYAGQLAVVDGRIVRTEAGS